MYRAAQYSTVHIAGGDVRPRLPSQRRHLLRVRVPAAALQRGPAAGHVTRDSSVTRGYIRDRERERERELNRPISW